MERSISLNVLNTANFYHNMVKEHAYENTKNNVIAAVSVVAFIALFVVGLYFLSPTSISNVYSCIGLLPITLIPLYHKVQTCVQSAKSHLDASVFFKKIIDNQNFNASPIQAYIDIQKSELRSIKIKMDQFETQYIEYKAQHPRLRLGEKSPTHYHDKLNFKMQLYKLKETRDQFKDEFFKIHIHLAYLTHVRNHPEDTSQFQNIHQWHKGAKPRESFFTIRDIEITRKKFFADEKDQGIPNLTQEYSQKFALNPPQAV